MATSDSTLEFFAAIIQKNLGIVYGKDKYFQLEMRLEEIARDFNLAGIDELFTKARAGLPAAIMSRLLDVATNNETYFFRDPPIFEFLENYFSDGERNDSLTRTLDVWSAACSYGQEPYSIAMMLESVRKKPNRSTFAYKIVATDISKRALEAAKSGVFSQLQVNRGLNADQLKSWFVERPKSEKEPQWQVVDEIRTKIRFAEQNLLDSYAALGNFDLIFCRNVLIYQTMQRREEIIGRMYESLRPGGVLVMGTAESLIGIDHKFEPLRSKNAIVYLKSAAELQKAG